MSKFNKLTALIVAFSMTITASVPIFADEIEEAATDIIETTDISVETDENGEPVEPLEEPQEPKYTYRIEGLGDVKSAYAEQLSASSRYYNYQTEQDGVKQSAHVVVGDMSRGALIRGVAVGENFAKRGRLTSLSDDIESENRLLAAVNADFFSTSTGVPMGVFVSEGRFISSSDDRYAIGIDEDGGVILGKVGDSITLTHGNYEYTVSYLNKYPTVYGTYLLTRDFGETTRLSSSIKATEYVIELKKDIVLGKTVKGKITEIRKTEGGEEIPEDCAVLVVPDAYEGSELYRALDEGDRIELTTTVSEDFEGIYNAVGGGDVILIDGEATDWISDEAIETNRNPRTALGITEDGKIVMLVVDGRRSGYSSGVKMTALAEAMKELGCVSAINLDGGGSSIMVLYEEGLHTDEDEKDKTEQEKDDEVPGESTAEEVVEQPHYRVVNMPSDGAERTVPSAVAMYENRKSAKKLHILDASVPETLIFAGAKVPLVLTLTDSDGENAEFEFNGENTVFSVDEMFGSVAFEEGIPMFTAASADGFGRIGVTVTYNGETVSADVFLNVTTTVDTLTLDQNFIFSDSDVPARATVVAKLGDREVWFGDMLSIVTESSDITCTLENRDILFALADENTEISESASVTAETTETTEATELIETSEPSSETGEPSMTDENGEPIEVAPLKTASGLVSVYLGDKSASLYAYFDSELSLGLSEIFAPHVTVNNEGYTVEYDAEGGIYKNGAFTITNYVEETTETIVTDENGEPAEIIDTAEVTETTENTEISETSETVEETETAEPVETSDLTEESLPEDGTSEAEATDEIVVTDESGEPVFAPFEISVDAPDAIVSRGLSGRRLWMWADGLTEETLPYAVFETESGEVTVYYDRFYDFLDFNGRALFTLSLEGIEGVISLKTLFAFTAYEEEQCITLSAPVMAEMIDTNQYTDTAEHWSSYYVNALSYMGIVSGSENLKGELVYNPDNGLSREQFAKILVNYLKIDTEEYLDTALDFADMDAIAPWAIPFVRAAVGAGLMKGRSTPKDTVIFAPTDRITRQEAIYVLGGLLSGVEGGTLAFTDSDKVASWAAENLSKALTAGLISGYDDGSLRPEGGITRAEAATIVVRLYEFSSES